MNSSNPLVSSIITDARNKADEILSTAAKEAQSIIAEAEEKARKGEEAEERSLAQRLEQIRLRKESARKSIDRLSELRALDSSGRCLCPGSPRLRSGLTARRPRSPSLTRPRLPRTCSGKPRMR